MDRRDFLALSVATAAGAALTLTVGDAGEALAAGKPRARTRMKVGCQMWSDDLPFLQRNGVTHYVSNQPPLGPDGVWRVADLVKIREDAEAKGMHVEQMYTSLGAPECFTPGPERDRALDHFCRMIRAAGEAGIPSLKYGAGVPPVIDIHRTDPIAGRGGALYTSWDYAKARPGPGWSNPNPLPEDEIWERYTYFVEHVMPVAAEYKVRMAMHPVDPPLPRPNPWGLTQVLDTVEGLKRYLSLAATEYHGLTFCQGSIYEMLVSAGVKDPVNELYDTIRYFGKRKKIANVHFRNLRCAGSHETFNFQETYHDEGDIDMLKAILAYKEVGYEGTLMPDHVPSHPDDPKSRQGFAFAYGYIRGLLQAVNEMG